MNVKSDSYSLTCRSTALPYPKQGRRRMPLYCFRNAPNGCLTDDPLGSPRLTQTPNAALSYNARIHLSHRSGYQSSRSHRRGASNPGVSSKINAVPGCSGRGFMHPGSTRTETSRSSPFTADGVRKGRVSPPLAPPAPVPVPPAGSTKIDALSRRAATRSTK